MKGWVLYREDISTLDEIPFEIKRLMDYAEPMGIELEIYYPEQFDLVVTRDDDRSILLHGKPIEVMPDFVLTRLGAVITYFGQAVVRQFERQGVRVINSSTGIERSKDKLYSQQILAASGLPVPKTMLLKQPFDVHLIEERLKFPVVLKTVSGSKGSGVFLAGDRGEFEDLVDFLASTKGSANIILQEFIKASHGRDLRVFVVGGRVLACMERFSESGSFKANVSRGANAKPHEVTPEIEWLATETARILDLDIAGIDLLLDGDTFQICEANASPGFKGIERCFPERNMAEEIFRYIQLRVGFYRRARRAKPKKAPLAVGGSTEELPATPKES